VAKSGYIRIRCLLYILLCVGIVNALIAPLHAAPDGAAHRPYLNMKVKRHGDLCGLLDTIPAEKDLLAKAW
jgi:hypothetical protein